MKRNGDFEVEKARCTKTGQCTMERIAGGCLKRSVETYAVTIETSTDSRTSA
jgi:hypothetical protein